MTRWTRRAIAAGLGLAAVALFAGDPASSRWFPPCPWHACTGWYCPGCGSLRGLHALLHGDVTGAWSSNPLMIAALPFLLVGLVDEGWRLLRGEALIARRLPPAAIWAVFAITVTFGIARNLPALAVLAPH